MLHAINSSKARLGSIIPEAKRQPREDLITSCLFGTIEFLSKSAQSVALRALTGTSLPGDAEIYLWPFFRTIKESSEPDVVLRVRDKDGYAFWIVEVKWGAGLGDEQIGREIRTVRSGECRRGALPRGNRNVIGYTLLGAEAKHAANVAQSRSDFRGIVNDETWQDVTKRLHEVCKNEDAGLAAWAQSAHAFLIGTSKGGTLGTWPHMNVPLSVIVHFSKTRVFNQSEHIRAVSDAQFAFRRNE